MALGIKKTSLVSYKQVVLRSRSLQYTVPLSNHSNSGSFTGAGALGIFARHSALFATGALSLCHRTHPGIYQLYTGIILNIR